MAELLIDLVSEHLPVSFQKKACDDLVGLLCKSLAPVSPRNIRGFYSARHIAVCMDVDEIVPAKTTTIRGPRENAHEKAITGFAGKHGVSPSDLSLENGFFVFQTEEPSVPTETLVASQVPEILWKFPWKKSMTWGESSFRWARPLTHVVCLLDGTVVPFMVDTVHELKSGNISKGNSTFTATGFQQWLDELKSQKIEIDPVARKAAILEGLKEVATKQGLELVEDESLLDEVTGLVETPNPLVGSFSAEYMELPPEILQVSMKVHQKYFSLAKDGKLAPFFSFVANQHFSDGGILCITGNERVLNARFSDARHFWIHDRKTSLEDRVSLLENIIFHQKIGTQLDRVKNISKLAVEIGKQLGLSSSQLEEAEKAGYLSKADLTTGMVGEFPELQGIMGGYYCNNQSLAKAISEQYLPYVTDPVSIAVSLADKVNTLAAFFSAGEIPTGNGDPYGLRRSSLHIIKIILGNKLKINFKGILEKAMQIYDGDIFSLHEFFLERTKVLFQETYSHQVISAVIINFSFNFVELSEKMKALSNIGTSLPSTYKRASNFIDEHVGGASLTNDEEVNFFIALVALREKVSALYSCGNYELAINELESFCPVVNGFLDTFRINSPDENERKARKRLLGLFVSMCSLIGNLSHISH